MRRTTILLVVLLVGVGAVCVLYGLFALAYGGDAPVSRCSGVPGVRHCNGSSTYVSVAGHRFAARLAGALSIVLGAALLASARAARRWERGSRAPRGA